MNTVYNFFQGKTALNKDFIVDAIWMDDNISTLRYYNKDKKIKVCGTRLEFNSLKELEEDYKGTIKDLSDFMIICE